MSNIKKLVIGLIIASVIVFASIGSFLIIPLNNPSTKTEESEESFEPEIEQLMADYEIPSLAAGIIINDSLVWANGFGDQHSLDTVYMIGSITKTFTATAILQLYERNLLNLNDDINDHLPFDVRHPNYSSTPITIRMLLSHTAGLSTHFYWSLEYYFDDQMIDWINSRFGWNIIVPWVRRPTLGEFLNGSLNPSGAYYDPYNWPLEPGTEFLYSNAGFQVLGYLIEQITNQSLEEYFQENIFYPLNMTSSGFNYLDFGEMNAIPHEWRFNSNYEFPLYNMNVSGAGVIRSTIPDMAKYLIAYMNQGEYNGTQLLSPPSVELVHTKQVSLSGTTIEGFEYDGYGLGWNLYKEGFKGHGGATPGFSSNLFFKENKQGTFGVILMFNRGSALIYDGALISSFIPAINALLLEEA
ncbi:MAG: serine hydrolase domain-containing protein, partial [Promethearchaeota archaeon]